MAEDPPKKQECKTGSPAWMCTFADLMSLLMCFFILLLSFSVMDVQQYYEVAGSLKDAFGTQTKEVAPLPMKGSKMVSPDFEAVPLHVQIRVARVFSNEIKGGFVEADYGQDGLTLRVKGNVAFDSGRARIKEEFYPFLDKLGKVAQEMDLTIQVAGHTDNVPLKKGSSSYKNNWELSAARSVGIVEFWVKKMEIPPQRLAAIAYAEGRPIATNDTEEGRARNRRVEFKIRPSGPNIVIPGIELQENPIEEIGKGPAES